MRAGRFGLRICTFVAGAALLLFGMGDRVHGAGPVRGGVLHIATNAEPGTLDWTASTATATRLVAWHIYETLFALDKNYEVRPMLAEGYSVSADGLHYTVRLRKGVTFHTGQPMTADDVVASLERWGKMSGGGRETFRFVKQVTKVDPATIEIELSRIFTPLIANIADPKEAAIIMPASLAESSGLKPVKEYIGTGPYMFKRWDPGHEIVLVRNPNYASRTEEWGGLTGKKVAYADEIDFLPVRDDQVRFDGVSTGQYDLALELQPDFFSQVKANPHLTASIVKVFTWRAIVFNKARAPFGDVRMRQAVMDAIKPADLMAAEGPHEFWTLDPGLFFPEQRALYSVVGKDVYNRQNLEKAKGLLKEAGYAGQKIAVMMTKDYTWNYNLTQVLVPELQAVGLNVDEQVYDWPTLLSRRAKPEGWDIFMTGFSPSFDPTAVIFFSSTWPGFYKSPAMEELLGKWGETPLTDAAARKALMDQIQATFYKEVPVAKIGNEYGLEVYGDRLHGYSGYFDVRFWNTWVTR
ncbi:MAG TPA: ABC transporter substrate-binding protein [bacterium]|nr:ABC transporter substrate-binding protein [bacterium]